MTQQKLKFSAPDTFLGFTENLFSLFLPIFLFQFERQIKNRFLKQKNLENIFSALKRKERFSPKRFCDEPVSAIQVEETNPARLTIDHRFSRPGRAGVACYSTHILKYWQSRNLFCLFFNSFHNPRLFLVFLFSFFSQFFDKFSTISSVR